MHGHTTALGHTHAYAHTHTKHFWQLFLVGLGPYRGLKVFALCRLSGVRIVNSTAESKEMLSADQREGAEPGLASGCILNPVATGSRSFALGSDQG